MSKARHLFQAVAADRQTESKDTDREKAKLLLGRCFPEQRDFIKDPSDRKAALCPRQCGKSFAVLVYALQLGLLIPGARVLILARVRRQVKGTYWADLKAFCRDFELGAKFHGTDLECRLPNGSCITLAGADNAEEVDKHRGQRYDLIIIDEGKSYSAELMDEMLREVLEPALLAKRGTLAIIGTPGAVLTGPFWEITTCQPNADGRPVSRRWRDRKESPRALWSLHSWTQQDNTFCPWIWEKSLELKENHGYRDDDPAWRREFLGHWVPDADMLVYEYCKVTDTRCDWVRDPSTRFGLPAGHVWRLVLGMDIGFHDDTSFVVAAWSQTHPDLFYIHAEKHPELIVEEIAAKVKELEAFFGSFDAMVADTGGLGKTIVQSLAQTYGVAFVAARKQDKVDHIKLLNSDIRTGRIKLDRRCVLVEEWKTAQWSDGTKSKVDPLCDDHASDAALYIWRYCQHHWHKERAVALEKGTPEWWAKYQKDDEKAAEAKHLAAKNPKPTSRYSHLLRPRQNRISWTSRISKRSWS